MAPAINSCSEKDGPFLSCVASQVMGRSSPDQSANVATEANDAVETKDERLAAGPASDADTDMAKATEPVVPDFTIARAAPDGMVVIVGTADPEHEVSVLADGEILGKTEPERTGEWVFVPEQPLASGGVEITVQAATPAGGIIKSAKSEIVLIDEARDKEPIVIAAVPGEASEIIQGLDEQPDDATEAPIETADAQTEAPAETTSDTPAATESSTDMTEEAATSETEGAEEIEVAEAEAPSDDSAEMNNADAEQPTEAEPAAEAAEVEQVAEAEVNADAQATEEATFTEETEVESEVEVADSTSEEPAPTDSNDSENASEADDVQVRKPKKRKQQTRQPIHLSLTPQQTTLHQAKRRPATTWRLRRWKQMIAIAPPPPRRIAQQTCLRPLKRSYSRQLMQLKLTGNRTSSRVVARKVALSGFMLKMNMWPMPKCRMVAGWWKPTMF